jgi:hypothetical protein
VSAAAASITPGIAWDDYVALPGASITRLKELRRSPMHYRHRLLHPKESPAMTLGRAAHCAVLEPERFERDHAVWTRRTASGNLGPRNGQHWEAFKATAGDRDILTEDEHADALAIQRAVRANPDAMQFLEAGDAEVTMQWSIGGIACKGRIDWLTGYEGQPAIVGLKSTRDCRERQFGRQSANLGYHLQWGFYRDGYRTITGGEDARVFEIAVEPEAPHASVVYEIPDEVLQQGFDEYMQLLELLAECERTNHWPGPAPGIQTLTLPAWVYGEEEISYVDE